MYVFCKAFHQWLHLKCVFEEGYLALTLTKKQWEKCNCVCAAVSSITTNNLTTVYHSVETVKNIDQQSVVNQSINVRDNVKKTEKVALSIEDNNIKLSCSKTMDNGDKPTENEDSITKSTKTSSKPLFVTMNPI